MGETDRAGHCCERVQNVLVVTFDRPPVNAFDAQTYRAVRSTLAAADADSDVRAIVLTGAGDRAFSAGTDLAELREPDRLDVITQASLAFFETLSGLGTPVIGALNGPAVGGGAMIAADCDVLLAVRGARVGVPELHLGFPGAASHLKRLVPYSVALRMLLLGEQPDAEQLLAFGALATVVDGVDRLRCAAMQHARLVAALDPDNTATARSIFRREFDGKAMDGYRSELEALHASLSETVRHRTGPAEGRAQRAPAVATGAERSRVPSTVDDSETSEHLRLEGAVSSEADPGA